MISLSLTHTQTEQDGGWCQATVKLLNITKKSGNLRKDLKHDIVDSVSTLRSIFVNLRNSVEEQTTKINQLVGELNKAKAELMDSRVANLPGRTQPSRGRIGQTTTSAPHYQLPPSSGPTKLYSEAVNASQKRDINSRWSRNWTFRQRRLKMSLGQR